MPERRVQFNLFGEAVEIEAEPEKHQASSPTAGSGTLTLFPEVDGGPAGRPGADTESVSGAQTAAGAVTGARSWTEGTGGGALDGIRDIVSLELTCRQCRKCELRSGCRQVVFGDGDPRARVVFVGEAPGEQEDILGRPFVGAAGQLLDTLLAEAGMRRSEVYIANIVKCRPPGNRLPTWEESMTCVYYLRAQIRVIQPSVVVCLGALSTQVLIDKSARITKMRGQWVERPGARYMPTFHPAAVLRDELKRRPLLEDLRKVAALLKGSGPGPGSGPASG